MTFQVYSLFDVHAGVDVTTRRTLTACVQLVAYTNCAVNPLIYCLLNDRFRSTLSRLAVTVKLCHRGGPSTDSATGHLLASTRRTHVAAMAGPPLRLGLLVTRDAGMTVDIAGIAVGSGQIASCGSERHASRTGKKY